MKTMLIAIDSEIITDELVHTFQSKYQVHTCSQGDDALRILQELRPDVLMINLALSHITGLEVLQQTKYAPPVIIALTNFLSDSVVLEAQDAGVGAIIRLPCSINYILHCLNVMLAQQDKQPSS